MTTSTCSKKKTKKNATIFIHSQINSETHQKWHFIRHFVENIKKSTPKTCFYIQLRYIFFENKTRQWSIRAGERERENLFSIFIFLFPISEKKSFVSKIRNEFNRFLKTTRRVLSPFCWSLIFSNVAQYSSPLIPP